MARRCTIGALFACAGVAGLAAGEAVAGGPSLLPVPTTITSIISVTSSIPKVTVPLPAPVPPPPVPPAPLPLPAPPPVTTAVPKPPATVSNPIPSAPNVATTAADAAAAAGASGAAPVPPNSSAPTSPAPGSPAGASGADAAPPAANADAERRSAAKRRSATIVLRLSRGGRIEFLVYGRAPECELLGRFVRKAKRGVNRFKFAGRVAGQVLEPGIYTMTLNRLRSTQRVRLGRISVLVAERGVRVVRERPLCAVERGDGLPGGAWVAPPTKGSRDGSSFGDAAGASTAPETSGRPAAVPKVLSAVGESVGESLDLISPFVAGIALGLTLLGLVGVAVGWSRFWRGGSNLSA